MKYKQLVTDFGDLLTPSEFARTFNFGYYTIRNEYILQGFKIGERMSRGGTLKLFMNDEEVYFRVFRSNKERLEIMRVIDKTMLTSEIKRKNLFYYEITLGNVSE